VHISILYQDEDLVAIDKPVGVPTHPAEAGDPYVSDALGITQAQLGLAYLGMHQRLDADTSGVLLFSTQSRANVPLAKAFESRAVQKSYLAIVRGVPHSPEATINAPIGRMPGGRYAVTSAHDPRGFSAETQYRLLETSPDQQYSLLMVTPKTGRTHQIRVHLAHEGLPVLGDPLYGPVGWSAPRLCLHAAALSLPHPISGTPLVLNAPIPSLFGELMAQGAEPHSPLAWLPVALDRREPLSNAPDTTIYRLINGVVDGFPGLTADRYGPAVVLSVFEGPDEPPQPEIAAVAERLGALPGVEAIYLKRRPKHASHLAPDEQAALAPEAPLRGLPLPQVLATEDGLRYALHPDTGFSAGLFPDMREMRGRVRAWAKGRTVLNCFAFTCGFGVAAMAGGASRVLNLDLSRTALAHGEDNYRLNGLAVDPHDFVYGDVFDWLARLARRPERFDMVILDPPGFSRGKLGVFSAAKDYGMLARLAAALLSPGGRLIACCNVRELVWRTYRNQVLAGIAECGRTTTSTGVFHEPQLDFPFTRDYPSYLKVLIADLA
jgi:23S rRNA (cytosine1962-C5)-methyltransferase